MRAFTQLLAAGKVSAIGFSNFSCEDLDAAREFGPVHAIEPHFSLLNPRAADDLIPYCRRNGIAVLPYSPLSKGLLTGKFRADSRFSDLRARDPEFLGSRFRRNLVLVERLAAIAERCGRTLAQLVLNWTATFPGVTAPIMGVKRPSQVAENLGAVDWTLTPDDRAAIDRLIRTDVREP